MSAPEVISQAQFSQAHARLSPAAATITIGLKPGSAMLAFRRDQDARRAGRLLGLYVAISALLGRLFHRGP